MDVFQKYFFWFEMLFLVMIIADGNVFSEKKGYELAKVL